MIISRTPLRMSFVGGGSDLPAFYRRHSGAVVSTSIDKFVYVTVNKKFDDSVRVSYSKTEEASTVEQIEHPIVREALKLFGVKGGVEITSVADVPSSGTGLGSSSAFAVGLSNALNAFLEKSSSAKLLAEKACEIEIDILREPIGRQDQYASAYGGLNLIQFHPDDTVEVRKLICKRDTVSALDKSCIVFYTGKSRSASKILKGQSEEVQSNIQKFEVLKSMTFLAHEMAKQLESNKLGEFGAILHENWKLKKSLADGVSSDIIDDWYERGLRAGASGGKLLGAGSGGFLMFFADPRKHSAIAEALPELRRVDFGFERTGSTIIFVH